MSGPEDVSASGGSVTPRGVHHVLLKTDESQNQSTFTVKFNNGGAEGIFRVKYDNEVEGRAVLLADPCRSHSDSTPPEKRKSVVAVPSPPPLDSQALVCQAASDAVSPSGPAAESTTQKTLALTTELENSPMTSAMSASVITPIATATTSTPVAATTALTVALATATVTKATTPATAARATDATASTEGAGVLASVVVHEAKTESAAPTFTAAGYPAAAPRLSAVSQGPISGITLKSASSAASPKATAPTGLQRQAPHFILECIGVASGVRHDLNCEVSGPAALRVGREVQSSEFWSKLIPHEASRTGISREHFEIHENNDSPSGFALVNLSRAGTVRNGVSVKTEEPLDIGDVITLGMDQSPEAVMAGWKVAAIQFHFAIPCSSPRNFGNSWVSKPSFLVRLTCIHVAGRSADELVQFPESARSLESRRDSTISAALLRVGRSLQVAMWWEKLLPDVRLVNGISREHFQIRCQTDGTPLLKNLSAAGTFINGKCVREICAVSVGDRIGIPSSKPGDILVEFEYHQVDLAAGEQSLAQGTSCPSTEELSRTPVMGTRAHGASASSPSLFHIMREAAALPTETSLNSVTTVSTTPFSFECVSVRGQTQEHVAKVTAEVAHVLSPAAGQLTLRVGRTVQAFRFWEVLVPDAGARNALSRECFEVTMTKDLEPSFCMQNLSGHGTMLNESRVHTQAQLRHGDILGIGAAQAHSGGSDLVPVVQLRFVIRGVIGLQDAPVCSRRETGNIENESTTASTNSNRDGCEMLLRKFSTTSTATVVQSIADVDALTVSREDILARSPYELAEADPLRLSHSAILPPVDALPKFADEDDHENHSGVDNMSHSLDKMALGKLEESESQIWALEGSISSIERAVSHQEMTPAEAREHLAQLQDRLVGLRSKGVDSVELQSLVSISATEACLLKQELMQKSDALQSRLERICESLPCTHVV